MPPFFEQAAKAFTGFAKSEVASEAEAFLKSLGVEAKTTESAISVVGEQEQLARGLTPTGSGTSLLSHEELARKEAFYKVSRSGALTYLGKQPDAPLRIGEAVLALHRMTGEMRVVSEAASAGADLLEKFGPRITQAAHESGLLAADVHKTMMLKQAEELAARSMVRGSGHDASSMLNRNMRTPGGSRKMTSAL